MRKARNDKLMRWLRTQICGRGDKLRGDLMDKFKHRLREALLRNFLSQEGFAEEMGTYQCAVSRWLNGKDIPKANTLAKMCKVLHVSADWLLGLDGGKDER